ncbi:hypothetical protein LY78DRAFT_187629 [Colletotrichum sublineola]|nr:hypothetical protein LY78DRAFT_187629 [Colletotrichum sublineola]
MAPQVGLAQSEISPLCTLISQDAGNPGNNLTGRAKLPQSPLREWHAAVLRGIGQQLYEAECSSRLLSWNVRCAAFMVINGHRPLYLGRRGTNKKKKVKNHLVDSSGAYIPGAGTICRIGAPGGSNHSVCDVANIDMAPADVRRLSTLCFLSFLIVSFFTHPHPHSSPSRGNELQHRV